MDKQTLLDSLSYALKSVLTENLDGLDRDAMELNIDRFMEQDVAPMSVDDILSAFYTPEESMQRFMAFLERSGALDDYSGNAVH